MMVLEFGVPSSLGSAHHGSLGRDQGGHHEADAMDINAGMLRTQHDLGLSGGFVFAKRSSGGVSRMPSEWRLLSLDPPFG
ncbi:MAG: hypothetical protein ACERLM_07400 [Acidimicrobiales bacterium]